ncbi:unnamed protein product [Candidula unifasciata]|uniref:Carboxylesterase type B domain-containing protein n=1 Tax=Candidula unifasciata TaxID=100452 RepID=A0A8S3Z3S7_9EUPU|nr:unnamed protein product [Candidula unifasciata]
MWETSDRGDDGDGDHIYLLHYTIYFLIQSQEQAVNRTKNLACLLDCSMNDMSTIVDYLREASPQLLTQTQWKLTSYYFDPPFAPVVDGKFLLKHPSEVMAEGKVKNTSLIVGVVKDEGTYWLLYGFSLIFGNRDPNPVSPSQYSTVVEALLKPLGDNFTTDSIKHLTMNEYYDSVPPQTRGDYLDAADDICGDLLFKCAVVNFGQLYSRKVRGQVFMYSYEHRASTNTWPLWVGAPHGYELDAFFGRPWSEPGSNYSDSERALSDDVMYRISNFAKTGDPNQGLPTPGVNWPVYTTEDQHYLVMNAGQMRVDQGLRHRECEFWRTQVPIFQAASYPRSTCEPSSSGRLRPWQVLLLLCVVAVGYQRYGRGDCDVETQ